MQILICLYLCCLPLCLMSMPSEQKIVYQPQFKWADQTTSLQGTGSFIKTPNGDVIGLTSAHFINFAGPHLLEVSWLDTKTKKAIATSNKSFGLPGREGSYNPMDFSHDYFLMDVKEKIHPQYVLELDDRKTAEIGERIWFPNKNNGDLEEGTISHLNPGYLAIILDKVTNLQSRSGTPIISQRTGKVVGILSAGGNQNNKTMMYLTPSPHISEAIKKAKQHYPLKEVVGKKEFR